jgi:hypothetical protein
VEGPPPEVSRGADDKSEIMGANKARASAVGSMHICAATAVRRTPPWACSVPIQGQVILMRRDRGLGTLWGNKRAVLHLK